MTRKAKGISRRGFMKTAGAAALAASLPGASASQAQALEISPIPLRPFGKSGVKVPILSMGGMYDTPNNQLMLHQALRLGVTYWDTAARYGYGRSETGMGMYLAKRPQARKNIFLVSKSPARDPEGLSRYLEASLKRLQTSYLDLYFVHGISSIDELDAKTRAWATAAKKAGKIKLFGFSTHRNMEECLAGAAKLDYIDGIMFTYNYYLTGKPEMNQAMDACYKKGIGLTAMKTMGARTLSSVFSSGDEKALASFVKRGFTQEQAKLKVVWQDKRIAAICSQMPNLTILMANAAAARDKTKLVQADLDYFQASAQETAHAYCAGCGNICARAAGAAAVPEVMRYLMYYRSYGEPEMARDLYQALPLAKKQALEGADLAAAEAACPNRMPIAELVARARELLSA